MRFHKTVGATAVIALALSVGPVLADSGSATGNGSSTLAGPAGKTTGGATTGGPSGGSSTGSSGGSMMKSGGTGSTANGTSTLGGPAGKSPDSK